MISQFPARVMFVRITNYWYQMIKASYITTGSAVVNCWHVGHEEADSVYDAAEPGALALFYLQAHSGDMYVMGGGFLIKHEQKMPEEIWQHLGVRNGAPDYDAFVQQIENQDGSADRPVSTALFDGVFIFARRESILIPAEFAQDFKISRCFTLSGEEPVARYLVRVSLQRRFPQLQQGRAEHDWPGIYIMASQRRSFMLASSFKARMFSLYNFTCAVSGSTARTTLDAAHIKTFFDDNFHHETNCIVMRTDIHRLFSQGLMTARYRDADHVTLRCSECLKADGASEYLAFDGCDLRLPADRQNWPSREYLEWHQDIRFEHWLKFGPIKPFSLYTAKEKG